jgi:chemotaxis protein histidine kinase CheA
MEEKLEEIKKVFIDNTCDELLRLRGKLIDVNIEDTYAWNNEIVEDVFMLMHGICGTAPMIGLEKIVTVSRKLEMVFNRIRNGEKEFSEQISVQTIRGIDVIISELNFDREKVAY